MKIKFEDIFPKRRENHSFKCPTTYESKPIKKLGLFSIKYIIETNLSSEGFDDEIVFINLDNSNYCNTYLWAALLYKEGEEVAKKETEKLKNTSLDIYKNLPTSYIINNPNDIFNLNIPNYELTVNSPSIPMDLVRNSENISEGNSSNINDIELAPVEFHPTELDIPF